MWMILGEQLDNNEKQDWVIFCPYPAPFIHETLFSQYTKEKIKEVRNLVQATEKQAQQLILRLLR